MQSPFPPARLMSCDDLLSLLRAGVPPLACRLIPQQALRPGLVAAALPGLPQGLPPRPVAARAGYAVRSDDLIGAGPLSPVMLSSPPAHLLAAEALPEGTDALLDPAALREAGPFVEICAETFPGEGVLPAGHHLPAHAPLVQDGETLGPARLLLLAMAGVAEVPCRIPEVEITGTDPAAIGYLSRFATGLGATTAGSAPDLRLELTDAPVPQGDWLCRGLALNGVQEIAVARQGNCITLRFAPQPERLALVALGLLRPLLDHLSGRRAPQPLGLPLSRKVSSPVGMSEILLLRRDGAFWSPLAAGEVSLAALSQADAVLHIPAGAEGWPAGHVLELPLIGERM